MSETQLVAYDPNNKIQIFVGGTTVQQDPVTGVWYGSVNTTQVSNNKYAGVGEHLVGTNSTNETSITNYGSVLWGYTISNISATQAIWVKFYENNQTIGSASITHAVCIQPKTTVIKSFTNGLAFFSGIKFATVTGIADNDTTIIPANVLSIDLEVF